MKELTMRLIVVGIVGFAVMGIFRLSLVEEALSAERELSADSELSGLNKPSLSDRIMFNAQIDANFSLSDRDGENTMSGSGLSAVVAPMIKLTDDNTFILLYNGEYYKRRDFYSDLVGPRERTEFQSHTITPMARVEFGDSRQHAIIPSIFFTQTYNKDVSGGDWGEGLYNYRDIGFGLDYQKNDIAIGSQVGLVKVGMQYYKRDYLNYESLLDLATGLGIERDERDYKGVLGKVGYSVMLPAGFSWGIDYYLLYKDLEGKKVVGSDGVLAAEGQVDYQHGLDLGLWYVPHQKTSLRIGLALNVNLNRSNQNYYDGLGTIIFTDDVFMADFYDYNSYRIRPNISYTFSRIPLTSSLSYSHQKTDYDGRLAQNSDSTYKGEKQEETQHEVSVDLRYDLRQKLSLYARCQYLEVQSNNSDESVYSYNYVVKNYLVGVTLRY